MNSFESELPSTRPYLVRALHEWCVDNGFSPYIAVHVDASVKVPMEFVNNGEIVLNVGMEATSGLRLGNDFIEFKARFGGVAREIVIPISHVTAIYARENGQGMAFPPPPKVTLRVADGAPMEAASVSEASSEAVTAAGPSERGPLRAVPTESESAEGSGPSQPQPDGPARGGRRPQLTRIK